MTTNKRNRIIVVALIFLISLTIIIIPTKTRAEENVKEVNINIKVGFNGFAKINAYMPVEVNIKNNGKAITGELQVEVLLNEQSKTAYAQMVDIPEGAEKTIKMNIPLSMASKDINVKLFNGRRLIKEETQSLIKIIDYGSVTMGVLSDDINALNYFNGIELGVLSEDIPAEKLKMMMAAGEIPNQGKIEMVALDSNVFPEDSEVINTFDILLISNYDTSQLNENQLKNLSRWAKRGNILLLGTGENWKKILKALPDELIPFEIQNTLPVNFPEDIFDTENPSVDGLPKNIISAVKKPDNGITLAGEEGSPLASKYYFGDGVICVLSFDPAQYSFSKWTEVDRFLSSLFSKVGSNESGESLYTTNNNSNYQYNLANLASQVPDGKQPPYFMIFITLGIYLLIVGPVLYLILKLIDKRDLSWVIIPALALVCTLIIYVAGFKTRYTTAVLNNVSVISLNENNMASIDTSMAAFNNKKGKMVFEYSPKLELNIQNDSNYYGDRYYSGNTTGFANSKLTSKKTIADPIIYELYDVFMWSPRNIYASKQVEADTRNILKDIQIKNNRISGTINNTTPYDLEQAFIGIGTNYIYIGDVLAGDSYSFDKALNEDAEISNLQDFLDKYYGSTRIARGQKLPTNYQEIVRRRGIMEQVFNRNGYDRIMQPVTIKAPLAATSTGLSENQITSINNFNISLYAFNDQALGYDIKINGQIPESFNTNAVKMTKELSFAKGSTVEIPSGLVLPQMNMQSPIAFYDYDNGYQSGIRVEQKGDIDLNAYIPQQFRVEKLEVEFGTQLPYYAKLMMMEQNESKNPFPVEILKNEYEYYVFNLSNEKWEKVDSVFTVKDNVNAYINANGELQLRIKVLKMADYGNEKARYEREMLSIPQIRFEGVVK